MVAVSEHCKPPVRCSLRQMVINTHSHLEKREGILQKDKRRNMLQGGKIYAHLFGPLC